MSMVRKLLMINQPVIRNMTTTSQPRKKLPIKLSRFLLPRRSEMSLHKLHLPRPSYPKEDCLNMFLKNYLALLKVEGAHPLRRIKNLILHHLLMINEIINHY